MNILVPIEEPVVARQPADLLAGRWNIAMALTSKGYAGSMSDGSQAGMELLPPEFEPLLRTPFGAPVPVRSPTAEPIPATTEPEARSAANRKSLARFPYQRPSTESPRTERS